MVSDPSRVRLAAFGETDSIDDIAERYSAICGFSVV
jgi:hypothetical protein